MELSCIGYCCTYSIECEYSEGIDKDALVHCQAERCPMEEVDND
jgi:hypothetical protein